MDLSFVILTWNSAAYLERCLRAISHAMACTVDDSGLRYEVLILDNGSRDGTARLLASLAAKDPDRLRPFYQPQNLGTTRSRNILFAAARGEYVCVMDSDVEVHPDTLKKLLPVLAADPELGVVVPRIEYPDGAWQKSIDRFPTLPTKIHRLFRLRAIEAKEGARLQVARDPFPVDYAISAFWLMPRILLDRIGLLDERIFYAPEDVDFCLRVWKGGYRVLYVPAARVVHHTQEISRGFKLNWAKFSHVKGLLYYFVKHRYLLTRPRFESGSPVSG